MIQHYLVGKHVGWYTLEEKHGKKKDFVRVYRNGMVKQVDDSNTLALVESEGIDQVCEIADLSMIR
jgi:hypothetical protein